MMIELPVRFVWSICRPRGVSSYIATNMALQPNHKIVSLGKILRRFYVEAGISWHPPSQVWHMAYSQITGLTRRPISKSAKFGRN